MRAQQRLKKLEQVNESGMVLGFYEQREGCEATEGGVTHAWIDRQTIARADFETDEDFSADIDARKHALADRPLFWLPSDPRLL